LADEKKAPPINLNLSRHTVRYLKRLKRSGLHGNKIGIVARTLVQDQIKALIQQGALRMEFDEDESDDDEADNGG
jgi:hypothetical protein